MTNEDIRIVREALESLSEAPGFTPYDLWVEMRQEEQEKAIAAFLRILNSLPKRQFEGRA